MGGQHGLLNIHASCIAAYGKGLLILGPSGAGKSALALQMIALGAHLVADDRCDIWAEEGILQARAPMTTQGLIEARGIGLMRLPFMAQTTITAAVDLAQSGAARMPKPQTTTLAGIAIDFLAGDAGAHFPSALMCYLMGQRYE